MLNHKAMYVYIIIVCSVVIFVFSNYVHLSQLHAFDHMVAFVGKEHVRTFEREFEHMHADLWAFGHRTRKSKRLQFGRDAFATFRDHGYKHMLLLNELHYMPLMYSESVIEYKMNNHTVASLWPILQDWPSVRAGAALDWYRERGGAIDIIYL